ncbi:hypothetical protein BO86DRAFT_381414 [Aspergillus japonicus CBS 114.51]|uniref:Uncharacterized protein n=2 Tax=Aspergillus TaxID=5052 RepID=A0A2V5GY22_ASPV1|nr:hypothetical protein BO86DRAFT_381414 [Aspergillus japonicus CBS 114.51]PYI14222.1 hypothetical protein BO99DRAFT_345522 [Aspergillus violaceofuscus CBS 115571]RAH79306.1 hypothetical protein BO86DRAFT_381414 [Aspergillus japonicus CBS 114.51]
MDGFEHSEVPAQYEALKWLDSLFIAGMGLGWLAYYLNVAYTSFRDQTYSMTIAGITINFAWEIVYCLVYPAKGVIERVAFFLGLLLDITVIYAAIRNGSNEWRQSPLVMNNLALAFAGMTLFWLSGHLALAAQLGPGLAYSWGAVVCQMFISVGDVFLLLTRASTRGASYTKWLSRFLGSISTIGFAYIRWAYWPGAFAWLNCPLILWAVAVFFLSELLYGFCFFLIKKQEEAFQLDDSQKRR